MLRAKNLRLKYPNGKRKIFDQLDIEIKPKEKVLLLGPSGSGKSTLLNVLSGIVPHLIDIPIKYDALDIDAHPGVIFQDPDTQFCMPKVYEELAFILENKQVPTEEMDAQIQHALARVNLNVSKDQHIQTLSGGMKQKLAIAETLLLNAETLFLDEPTAMLDIASTAALWEQIISMWQDQTVVIVEHKVAHIWDHVDRVILIDYQGKIIADDTPTTILHQHETLLSEYGVWHPKAWDHAPTQRRHTSKPTQPFNLQFENGTVLRGKRNLITIEDLSIHAGEWITITGANGSGKTSLLESLMQLIKYKGHVSFNHHTLKKIKHAAKHMYMVYQNPELQFMTNSVYDEIHIHYTRTYTPSEAKQKTLSMLSRLNLLAVKHQHPFELSVGQKRRLSVAIALSTNAHILLLDEPTFGLDSHNTFELIRCFQDCVDHGQTIVMVTHDPELIQRYATRQFTVDNERMYESAGDSHV